MRLSVQSRKFAEIGEPFGQCCNGLKMRFKTATFTYYASTAPSKL